MQLLKRNSTEFEYYPLTGEQSDLDGYGRHTGSFKPVFGEPIRMRGMISVPSGSTFQAFYGTDIRYTHTLLMDDPDAPITETGIVKWKGSTYEVRAVRRCLNVLNVALRQQTASPVPDGEGG